MKKPTKSDLPIKATPPTAIGKIVRRPTKPKAETVETESAPTSDLKWPPEVMARGYSMIPSILLWGQGRLELKPEEFNVLLQLVSHWWTKGENPHPSKETIARRMGKKPRTIQRHLTSLEEKGLIARVARFKVHKGQDSNGYDLRGLIKKLKGIAPEFDKVADQNKRRRAKAESKS